MQPTNELIDDIYRERVVRARRTAPDEKFYDGARLFEFACRITASGIQHQFPDADADKIDEILEQRLAIRERLEKSR